MNTLNMKENRRETRVHGLIFLRKRVAYSNSEHNKWFNTV